MDTSKLREQLKIDEGVKYEVYDDHLGYKTFGIGHLVTPEDEEYGSPCGTPIAVDRVNSVFDKDVETYISESEKVFGNLQQMPEEVQQVIVNMCFNMGAPRLSQFKKFIKAIHDEDWKTASVEMLDSRWAKQVGERANRLSDRIKAIN
jgi:lysozyme